MQVTKNFKLQEFIPREIYQKYELYSTRFIDPRLPMLAQVIREYFNKPMTINDWLTNGPRNYSGFRPGNCKVGAVNSSHKRGTAFDFVIKGMKPSEIQEEIKENFEYFKKYGLTLLETNTATWTHVSIEWFDCSKLVVYDYLRNSLTIKDE